MYSPDGNFLFDTTTNQWVPAPPQAPPPPPPQAAPPPPPGYGQGYAPPAPSPYGAPPPGYAPPQAAPPGYPQQGYSAPPPNAPAPFSAPPVAQRQNDENVPLSVQYAGGLDFNDPDVVGAASLPEGEHIVRVDDVEYGTTKSAAQTDRAVFKATTQGGQHPNRTGIWGYNLTSKTIFRLGKDLQKLGLGLKSNGQKWSSDGRTLAGELMQETRGKLIKIRVTPQIDRDTKMPSADGYTNTIILGWADGVPANPAPPPYTQTPPAGPTSGYAQPGPQAATQTAPPQVTYPQQVPNGQPGGYARV